MFGGKRNVCCDVVTEAGRAMSLCSHHLMNQTLLTYQMAKSKLLVRGRVGDRF